METAKTQPLPLRAEGGEPTLRTAPGVATTNGPSPPSSRPGRRLLMGVGAAVSMAALGAAGFALLAWNGATPEQAGAPVDDGGAAATRAPPEQTTQDGADAPDGGPAPPPPTADPPPIRSAEKPSSPPLGATASASAPLSRQPPVSARKNKIVLDEMKRD